MTISAETIVIGCGGVGSAALLGASLAGAGTVDEEADMRRLLRWGVDALITNRPDLGVRVRDEMRAR